MTIRSEARSGLVAQVIAYSIPAQIRAMREDRGWTQDELAERAGMAQSQISELETPGNGMRHSIKTLQRIAAAFDVALLTSFSSWREFIEWAASLDGDIPVPPGSGAA